MAPLTSGAGMPVTVRDDLGLFEGYHSPQVEADVRLNTNESPYPPPPAWIDDVRDAVAAIPFNRYPDRRALALRSDLGELHGVEPERVFCANGSNEILQLICLAYGGAGRTALVFEPTYALHSHIARVTGTAVALAQRDHHFLIGSDDVARAVAEQRPHITFLCSPNNPTGRADAPEVVEAALAAGGGLVVVDEAYGQFSPYSAIDLVDDSRPLVVVRTYSKTWSMAAARLGYMVGPTEVVAALEKVALPYHLDAVKQAAGRLALRYRPQMEARVATIVEERRRVAQALTELPVETWGSDANFILFRPRRRAGAEVWEALLSRSVLVRNCGSWPGLQDCLRVTIGTAEENSTFLKALTDVLGP